MAALRDRGHPRHRRRSTGVSESRDSPELCIGHGGSSARLSPVLDHPPRLRPHRGRSQGPGAKRLILSVLFLALISVWLRDLPLLIDNLTNGGAQYLFSPIR